MAARRSTAYPGKDTVPAFDGVFWLKNRRPDRWRDVQQLDSTIGHYLISDRPMTEEEWIEQRTKVIEAQATDSRALAEADMKPQDDTAKPLD